MKTPDGGPIYAETDLSAFPVEPWATFSTVGLLLVALYWTLRLQRGRNYTLFTCVILLYLAFVGALVYHATRSHFFWLALDFIPLALICVIAGFDSLYVGLKKETSFFKKFFIVATVLILPFVVPSILTMRSAGYFSLAAFVVPSLLLRSYSNSWLAARDIIFTLLSFIAAVTFRELDLTLGKDLLPMGTHFLWHLFGALTFFWLFSFVYKSHSD